MKCHSQENEGNPASSESTKSGGISRRDFVKYSAGTVACLYLGVLNTGCGGGGTNIANGSFPVAVFSDVHFNPFYDPSIVSELVARDAGDWQSVFESGTKTLPPRGADTNYPLLKLALSGIKQNLGGSPLVIFTGDILGHGIPQFFYEYLGIPDPQNPDDAAVAAMKSFTDKAVAFFMGQVREAVGNLSVMFAVGNSDSYSGYGPNVLAVEQPGNIFITDNSFLLNNADLFYTQFLNGAADHQAFLDTFTVGGYYSVEPAGTNLMVIGLNTILFCQGFSAGPDANDGIVAAELDWLDSKLAAATVKGKKVWLLMHAPPGGVPSATAALLDNGQIPGAAMMWYPAYQERFLKIISNYPGTISMTLAGHTHMDEYRILPSSEALEITPAITPWFGNDPAFKVFSISGYTLKPFDFSSLNYDLDTNPAQFNTYYIFSKAYSMQGPLDASLAQLTPALVTDQAKQALYRGHYYSGNDSTTPVTYPLGNSYTPITDATWPVYWSCIGNMEEADIVHGVNYY